MFPSIVHPDSEVRGHRGGEVVYLSLDHVLAVQAEVKHTAVQVDGSFRVQLLQNPIQGDERPCTADTSTNTHTHVKHQIITVQKLREHILDKE